MLQNIRDNSQGLIAKIIVGFVILTFALFGVDAIVSYQGTTYVADVDGVEISEVELNQAMYLQKRQLAERLGDQYDPSQVDDAQIRQQAIDALVKQQVILNRAAQENMQIAPAIVNGQIMQNESFQQDGKFSNELFTALLRSNGFTPQMFKTLLTQELTAKQLFAGIQSSEFVTEADMAVMAGLSNQSRDIAYLELALKDYLAKQVISDDEVQASYDKTKHQYLTPELSQVEYVVLNMAQFYPEIKAADLQEAYQLEVDNADSNGRKRISHILMNTDEQDADQAKANLAKAAERIQAGESFADVAKDVTQDLGSKFTGGDLGFANLDNLPDALAEAVKGLAVNQLSDVVETDSGFHLVTVTEIDTPEVESFEQAKARIELKLQKQQAEGEFVTQVEQLGDVTYTSSDLSEAAEQFKLEVQRSDLFSRQNAQGVLANSSVLAAAFDQDLFKDKNNSDVIELSDEEVLVLRVVELKAPEVKPLSEVKGVIAAKLKQEKAEAQMAAKADELMAQIKAGGDLVALAQAADLNSKVLTAATRQQADADRLLLAKAFALPAVTEQTLVDSATISTGNLAIFTVSNTQNGEFGEAEKAQSALMQRFLARSNGAQVLTRFSDYLEANSDIEIR